MAITSYAILINSIFLILDPAEATWMYLGLPNVGSILLGQPPTDKGNQLQQVLQLPTAICGKLKEVGGLVDQQLKLCEDNPAAMPFVLHGARIGLMECFYQFKFERWNCTATGLNNNYNINNNVNNSSSSNNNKNNNENNNNNIINNNNISSNRSSISNSSSSIGSNNNNKNNNKNNNNNNNSNNNVNIINNNTAIDLILHSGTRETAFVYAVTSAGVAHAITESCSSGNLTDCSCDTGAGDGRRGTDQHGDGGWKWGGCSDNVEYGIWFAENFVDAPDRMKQLAAAGATANAVSSISPMVPPSSYPGQSTNPGQSSNPGQSQHPGQSSRDVRALMNLHNNEVGRKVLSSLMKMKCRCHGISGSCGVRTCWRALPTFREVGETLKKKYENSVEISSKSDASLRHREKRKRREPIPDTELVFVNRSPNYCRQDIERGIMGTRGRECKKGSYGPEGCESLCCGRGFNVEEIRSLDRCHCRFIWCCEVKCKTCETVVKKYTCK